MFKLIPSVVPPTTSGWPIETSPCKPCNPKSPDVTLKLIGSKVTKDIMSIPHTAENCARTLSNAQISDGARMANELEVFMIDVRQIRVEEREGAMRGIVRYKRRIVDLNVNRSARVRRAVDDHVRS